MSERAVTSRPIAVGYGEVTTESLAGSSRNGPSLFADPVAWLMAAAVDAAAQDSGVDLTMVGDQVGMIAISDACTRDTMRGIAKATARGRVSPLKFAGANPGSVTGLPCIRQGFRGPTLTLSMPPADGTATAVSLAAAWLERNIARYVLIGTHRHDGAVHAVRCVVLQAAHASEPYTELDLSRLIAPAVALSAVNS
jgi:hypothetical protein